MTRKRRSRIPMASKGGRARAKALSRGERGEIARRAAAKRWTAEGRPLSPSALQAMSEEVLRVQVLIPLFQRMGYLDVMDQHGGTLEQGKDIVMWRRTEFGRTNYAVVVKAKRISGQASGAGSAGEVVMQINQCFQSPFHDGAVIEQQDVHECIVVCPYEIKTPARNAIASALDVHTKRHVRYLHGDGLWEEVRKHFGARAALNDLGRVGRVLENANPNYRIVARTRGAEIGFHLEPKHADAETQEPLVVEAKFAFPADDEGKAAMTALNQHFETGTPVKIDGRYVKDLKLPAIIEELFGSTVGSILLGPSPGGKPVRFTVAVGATPEDQVLLPDIEFRCAKRGTKEFTLVADRTPYTFELVLRPRPEKSTIRVGFDLDDVNVAEALEAARIQRLLANGTTLSLLDGRSRLPVMSEAVRAGEWDEADERFEDLLRDLVTIQMMTRTPLRIPSTVTPDDVREIRGVAKGVRSGKTRVNLANVSVKMGRRGVEEVLASPPNAAFRIAVVHEQPVRVVGNEVNAGRVATVVTDATVAPTERDRLKREIEAGCEECDVQVDCSTADANALYLSFLPSEELATYRAMFPNVFSA